MAKKQMRRCLDSDKKDNQQNACSGKYHFAHIGLANAFLKMITSSNGMVIEKWSWKYKLVILDFFQMLILQYL